MSHTHIHHTIHTINHALHVMNTTTLFQQMNVKVTNAKKKVIERVFILFFSIFIEIFIQVEKILAIQ